MRSIDAAELVPGRGIVGDRYHDGVGEFSPAEQDPDHELTLIEIEHVERFVTESGVPLEPGDLRRNVVTRGVDLNALVGREFALGAARLRGVRLCEPCRYLAELVHEAVVPGLVHKAGLRACIVRGGVVEPGDPVNAREGT